MATGTGMIRCSQRTLHACTVVQCVDRHAPLQTLTTLARALHCLGRSTQAVDCETTAARVRADFRGC